MSRHEVAGYQVGRRCVFTSRRPGNQGDFVDLRAHWCYGHGIILRLADFFRGCVSASLCCSICLDVLHLQVAIDWDAIGSVPQARILGSLCCCGIPLLEPCPRHSHRRSSRDLMRLLMFSSFDTFASKSSLFPKTPRAKRGPWIVCTSDR